jgi:hypothetical protein
MATESAVPYFNLWNGLSSGGQIAPATGLAPFPSQAALTTTLSLGKR